MPQKYITKAAKEARAELKLLLSLARGKKTFEQVVDDARDVSHAGQALSNLVASNAARGVTKRLVELSGVGQESCTLTAAPLNVVALIH